MKDKSEHWALFREHEEFHPLGTHKFNYLLKFVDTIDWKAAGIGFINKTESLKSALNADRRFASKVYTIFKEEVDEYIFDEKLMDDLRKNGKIPWYEQDEIEPKQKKAKTKAKKAPKKKKESSLSDKPSNVISFSDYKKKAS